MWPFWLFALICLIDQIVNNVVQLFYLSKGSILHLFQYFHLVTWYSSSWNDPLMRFRQHLFTFLVQLVEFSPLFLLIQFFVKFIQLLLLKNSLSSSLHCFIEHSNINLWFLELRFYFTLHLMSLNNRNRHFLLFLLFICSSSFLRLFNSLPVPFFDNRCILFSKFFLIMFLVLL